MAEKMIALTEEQFERLITAVGKPAAPPPPPTEEERTQAYVEQIRKGAREAHKLRRFACVSRLTECRFVAVVAPSKAHKGGRIITLEEYRYEEGYELHEKDGGRVPDGMTIRSREGQPSKKFKQWKYERTWKKDLAYFSGADFEESRRELLSVEELVAEAPAVAAE